jgi:dihydrofolate reductase
MVWLDGFFAGPNGEIDWFSTDAEFSEFNIEQMKRGPGGILFGRVTYQLMASYWPTATEQPIVADRMNSLPKVVFSRTLDAVDWNNSQLVKDNIGVEVSKLKQQPGADLAVFGSADLLSTLIQLNLVDEHRVMVNPVVLGRGKPLFTGLSEKLNLKLVDSRTFRSGNVLLTYQPASAP